MTKAELIDMVSEQHPGVSKADVGRIHDAIFDAVSKALKVEGRFAIAGFGTFDVRSRAERKGRNPQTGEEMTIPASKSVGFKPAAALKDSLN